MNTYSVGDVSKLLGISGYTLRYYDKIHLVSPKRKENLYRYYDDADLHRLKYIEVLKFAQFSLDEIKMIIINSDRTAYFTPECREGTEKMLCRKKDEILNQIKALQEITGLFDTALHLIQDVKSESPEIFNSEIEKIYAQIKGDQQ